MDFLGIFLKPAFYIIDLVLRAYIFVIIAQVILSWLVAFRIINTSNQFIIIVGEVLYRLTEPFLGPIRDRLPSVSGLDFSTFVLLLGIIFVRLMLQYLTVYLFKTL